MGFQVVLNGTFLITIVPPQFIPVQWSREDNLKEARTIWGRARSQAAYALGSRLYIVSPAAQFWNVKCALLMTLRSKTQCSVLLMVACPQMINTRSSFHRVTNIQRAIVNEPFSHGQLRTMESDVSWYKNNKNSASWFAVNYVDDFIAGLWSRSWMPVLLSITDHNIVPGKKFFLPGVSDRCGIKFWPMMQGLTSK